MDEPLSDLVDLLQREQPGDRLVRVAAHGDFWRGNVLFGSGGVGVIDWDGLRSSVALEDYFAFALCCVPYRRHKVTPVEAFEYVFFSPSPASRYLQKRVGELDISKAEARFSFYVFVAKRLVWKDFAADWQALLAGLRTLRFPAPTCFR